MCQPRTPLKSPSVDRLYYYNLCRNDNDDLAAPRPDLTQVARGRDFDTALVGTAVGGDGMLCGDDKRPAYSVIAKAIKENVNPVRDPSSTTFPDTKGNVVFATP